MYIRVLIPTNITHTQTIETQVWHVQMKTEVHCESKQKLDTFSYEHNCHETGALSNNKHQKTQTTKPIKTKINTARKWLKSMLKKDHSSWRPLANLGVGRQWCTYQRRVFYFFCCARHCETSTLSKWQLFRIDISIKLRCHGSPSTVMFINKHEACLLLLFLRE